jgi:LacI family transcriptional regulator
MKKAIEEKNLAQVYFCGDDSIALGALKAINEAGLKVPKDIGLIGFNDAPMSEYVFPSLSSVHVFTETIGQEAVVSLLEQIDGRPVSIRKVIPTYIKFRNSLR